MIRSITTAVTPMTQAREPAASRISERGAMPTATQVR